MNPSATSSRRPSFEDRSSGSGRWSGPQDSRRVTMKIDEETRYRAIIKHLYGKAVSMQWMIAGPVPPGTCTGILIRKTQGEFACEPEPVDRELLDAVKQVNPGVAMTIVTEGTNAVFDVIDPGETELLFQNGSQIQIFESMVEIASSSAIRKFQYAALLRRERVLLVWHDDLGRILSHAMEVESRLLALIWGSGMSPFGPATNPFSTGANSYMASEVNLAAEKEGGEVVVEEVAKSSSDLESGGSRESLARPLIFTSSIFVGLGIFSIILLVVGLGNRALVFETLSDKNYIRMALIASEPVFLLFGLFFVVVVFGNIFQMIGPITSIKTNSRFYSAIKPDLKQARALGFRPPPITIQMPIYTESLEGVIKPTVTSLKAAISYYESHGGTARIFINDDGMANRSEEENRKFMDFYVDNQIGWVSRPKHNTDGFVRKGKFKKASNMNFALNITNKMEDVLQSLVDSRFEKEDAITEDQEAQLYQQALQTVLAADSRAKAGGNIRMGEIILIVDSDTRVPIDCLMYGAAEMFLSPEVAIIQHSTGVMQVTWDYFENAITYFTNLVYTAIRFAVGSGEVGPFVGHNAFLRWQAVQSVGNPPEEDGYVAFWSESHVSEDFDIALRLQIKGNTVRLASYHGDGFKEGVSLTLYDELNRWEKYAYGCNELVFNPIYSWIWKGPFTKLFRTFLMSNMQLSSKLTIIGYISSYYAIASSVPFGILNYCLVGWKNGDLDKFYVESWKIFVSLIVVFNIMSNISLAILRYRLGEMGLLQSLKENFKWMPVFVIFFGGLSFHVSLAILSHMFSIDMNWGATAKEKDDSNFFKELPKIFSRFKWMYLVMVPLVGGMIYLGCFAPHGWEINGFTSVVPMATIVASHMLFPFALNPSLMVFNY
ncbi:glycosyl transferase family group 2-domain-containing protein [Massariosphaeria phaeospora]|uniref:Glycosyl transferase family group 2-domain-containing protein n=1 Tax=Massariosphaeria phaeospora TaxID=100035 RepID=A0A7C8M137_9PLEO|nr:glycosyl transferase family group 2-domain-containing protein [Massariosphaeria phaeospora]